MLAGITHITIDHPLALPMVYVNDTEQLSAGSPKKAMFLAITDFVDLVKSLHVTLRTEGVIVAQIKKMPQLWPRS